MVILPKLRCPGCGKAMAAVKAKEVPPAEKFEDCLRRCNRCKIGASNAKNPAKVKLLYGEQPANPPAEINEVKQEEARPAVGADNPPPPPAEDKQP